MKNMKKYLRYFIFGFYILTLTACSGNKSMKNISQIDCYTASGPVSPEYQWQENINITPDKVVFTRSGSGPDSLINAGTWIIPVDQHMTDELFSELETVDISTIKRVEFDDPIDGGGRESCTISYEQGNIFSVGNDTEGNSENGELITGPINAFLSQLDFPEDALKRELIK
jgi:hypothetical protein